MAGLEKIVTDDLVFEIADRLDTEGRKVSNRLIWDQIGGGSMTTIAAALRRWRERQQLKTEQAPERPALPEAIAETMRDAVDRLWKAAQEETQKEIDRLTQAMNERVAEATAERDEALAELQATAQDLQAAQERCSGLETEVTAAAQQEEALRAELAGVTKQAEIAASRSVEIERRADDLNAELARVHAQSQAERQRQAEAITLQAGQLDALRAELATAKVAARAEQQQNAALTRQVTEVAAQLTAAAADRDAARKEAAEARESAARLQGQVEAMTTQQADLMRALSVSREKPKADPASKPPKKGA